MSTYVYISRRKDPFDDAGPHITVDEWLNCVKGESDFRIPIGAETEWSTTHARVWSGYEIPAIFDWHKGQIEVKNPDKAMIVRMKALAVKLSATLFSENGELFNELGGHAGFLPGFP